jgi:hypothetical protein
MLKLGKQDFQDFKIYGILIAEGDFCIHPVNPFILKILIQTTTGRYPFFVRSHAKAWQAGFTRF